MKYESFIQIGYYRSDIAQKIVTLLDRAIFRYKLYGRINELGKYDDPAHIKESRDDFMEIIVSEIKEINNKIDRYNDCSFEVFGSKAKKIKIMPVRAEIKRIFKRLETDEEGYKLVAPFIEKSFHEFLMKTVDPVFTDLIKHKNDHDTLVSSFQIKSYPEIYRSDLRQMLDLFLLGYKSTALLVLGRVFEKTFVIWGNKLIENHKINKTKEEFAQLKLENMLGVFKTNCLISEKEWLLLSKLRLDRNIGGHYLSDKDALLRKDSEEEAEMTIRLTMPLIKKFHKKIASIK